ncbi:hypothetical protein N9854_04110 [Amylibacter sp.]|nr:hypothetical protein [Amylibacter sp.]
MLVDAPHYNRYLLYFLVVTILLPSLYFSFNGIYLSNPAVTLTIVTVGFLSFSIGYSFSRRLRSRSFDSSGVLSSRLSVTRQAAVTSFIALVLFSIFAPFRFKYNIGVPDFPPSLPYAGFIFYLTTYGVQALIIAAFILSKKKYGNFFVLLCGVFVYAIYEASLGWRIGMLQGIIILMICSSHINLGKNLGSRVSNLNSIINKLARLLFIILMIFSITSIVTQLQADVRDPGSGFAVTKIFQRFWGANYLDQTVTYFIDRDYGIFTNGSHFVALIDSGMSGAEFNNKVIHGNALGQHHGNSKTGFGSIYIYSGLIGVSIIFLVTGRYFRFVYDLSLHKPSLFVTTAAILHFALLFRIVNEQYDLGTLKTVTAIWICALIGSSIISFFSRLTYPRFQVKF